MNLEPAGPPSVLRTFDLVKKYDTHPVVNQLNLDVREGDVYGFLGRNGAGKTTTIRTVMGIIRSDGGVIELFGQKTKYPRRAQKQRIGYVSQDQHFYPWMTCARVGRFVGGFYPTWDAGEFSRLLERFDLPPKRKIAALSHGMQVKLALALALAHRPELLILDEPTAGLDPAARREFLNIVDQQARTGRQTTFFSTHIVEEVERVADKVGILDRGALCFEGRIDTLKVSVRRVMIDGGTMEPVPGLERVAEEHLEGLPSVILKGAPESWEAAPFPPESLRTLSLEDIFLALATGRVSTL